MARVSSSWDSAFSVEWDGYFIFLLAPGAGLRVRFERVGSSLPPRYFVSFSG